jgi:plastocyanin
MTKTFALICSVLALTVVAAGCGSDDNKSSDSGGGGTKSEAKPKAGGGGGGTGKAAAVSLKNIQFSPKTLSVAKGATVTWTNDDSVNHDVTKTGGPGPKFSSGSGNMAQGDTYKQKLTTAGPIQYVCTVHPGMTGTITVK